jgi:hypothetical protein
LICFENCATNFHFLPQNALGVFLQGASYAEQASRIPMEELEDAFGDKLVPLRNEPNEYAMSFL